MTDKKEIVFHHIELAHTSPNISGGEMALLEFIKYINLKFPQIRQKVYTSESGTEVFKSLLGSNIDNVDFISIGSKSKERFNDYFAYYFRIFQVFFYVKTFDSSKTNIIFSHDEFLPTMLFSFLSYMRNQNSKWIFFYHMKCPHLFKGFTGEFTNTYHFPDFRLIRYFVEQQIAFLLTKKADLVLTVNTYYEEYLLKKYECPVYVINKYGGVAVNNNPNIKKEYDVVWMGRFHAQKGLDDLIDIINKIKEKRHDVKLLIIGGGNKFLEEKLNTLIVTNSLSENVHLAGFVLKEKRFELLCKAKVFVMPSLYESFGQVILEAMKCGLPVVAYDLPVYSYVSKGIIKTQIRDNSAMAEAIHALLESKVKYEVYHKEALEFSSSYSWEATSEEIYDQILRVL